MHSELEDGEEALFFSSSSVRKKTRVKKISTMVVYTGTLLYSERESNWSFSFTFLNGINNGSFSSSYKGLIARRDRLCMVFLQRLDKNPNGGSIM